MKQLLVVLALIGAITLGIWGFTKPQPLGGGGGSPGTFFYDSASATTTAVGTSWSLSPILSANSGRGYLSFCNESTTAAAGIYLGLGATTTSASGIKIPGGSCYEMTPLKMFHGNIYAIASPTANSLLIIHANY